MRDSAIFTALPQGWDEFLSYCKHERNVCRSVSILAETESIVTLGKLRRFKSRGYLNIQLCPTLCDPMDCSPPVSSVHGILQERILEWVAMASSRGIFSTQGLNLHFLCLLHWQAGSLPLVPSAKLPAPPPSRRVQVTLKLPTVWKFV